VKTPLRTAFAGFLSGLMILSAMLSISSPAIAVTDPDPSFRLTADDLEFILAQIQISESHAAGNDLLCASPLDTTGKCVPDENLPYGLRTVDGSFNNLAAGQDQWGSADRTFPKLLPESWRQADPVPAGPGWPPNMGPAGADQAASCDPGVTCYAMSDANSFVYDSEPRTISNLIVDQTDGNPAAINAHDSTPGATTDPISGRIFIPNEAPDEGLSAPANLWFVFFGQFFDHGLDLVDKGGNGTLVVPLQPDDPLFNPATPQTNFLVLSRATRYNEAGELDPNGTVHHNETTPFVDQNQTYTSHPSHQFFLREYETLGGVPVDTGRLLEGTLPAGGIGGLATWNDVKNQARTVLGMNLTDADVLNVPQVAMDLYGNFIPHPTTGMPMLINDNGGTPLNVPGNIAAPISTVDALRTDHSFLDDIAHGATPIFDANGDLIPNFDENGDPTNLSGYDNVTLGEHFITGDGRGNENIGLTAVHHVFHSEHNRLAEVILNNFNNDPAYAEVRDAYMDQSETDDWSFGQRIFQAARFGTEMQYQHLVFEEFARRIQPTIDAIVFNENSYDVTIDPAIVAEFAHVVYRFGHSMLTEDIQRDGSFTGTGGATVDPADVSLLEGFLDPREYDMEGQLTPEQAAGAIINGTTNQVAGQIDEHIVDTLRNELLGLPLDLATINLLRARDVGTPPLQVARETFYNASGDELLEPYDNWTEFGLNLKNGNNFGRGGSNASLVNFVAAYGKHPTIVDAPTLAGKRNAASLLVNGVPSFADFLSRLAGATRYETAAAISRSQFATGDIATGVNGVPVAFIATGTNYPDALAGGPAAAAAGGPILLVSPNGIPAATSAELLRLNPGRIVILGGSAVVSNGVQALLNDYTPGTVTRLAGANRYATARAIAQGTFSAPVDTAYIASGVNFPDALAGAAVAARDGAPVLLVQPNMIPSDTAAALMALDPGRIVVLGGPAAVSDFVLSRLDLFTAGSVTRQSGANRYETAIAISSNNFPAGSADTVYLATGTNFPDALAAAAVAGLNGAPLLLVPAGDTVPANVMAEIQRLGVLNIRILGGTSVVSPAQELQLAGLAEVLRPAVGVPADRLAFMNSTGSWTSPSQYDTITGLEEVDFWVGGLAEKLDPFGGMLGATFNFVFEQTLEKLQFGDRFYYLFRNQGEDLFASLEANSFSKLIQRNTDASLLPADIFSIQDPYFDMEALTQPLPEGMNLVGSTYLWDGDEHIEIHGCRTPAGTECADVDDNIAGGQGDDSLWGYEGNDRIEGGSGNDALIGGPGNDRLTDTFGDDNIKGGLGNDYLHGGAGVDLLLGSHGDDFIVTGTDEVNVAFAGTGGDIILGGNGRENVFGGPGDDWMEGGAHFDLLQGDNANQFQNDPDGGDDVIIGGPGFDDHDSDGGDDIIVGGAGGADRIEGMMGYDWVTYHGTTVGINADLRFTVLQRPDVQAIRDRFDLLEAVSGGAGPDIIHGQNAAQDDLTEAEELLHKMPEDMLTGDGPQMIHGLNELLRPNGTGSGPDFATRFMAANTVQGDNDGVNNILLGGPGPDSITGRFGDDVIDGDAWLKVWLEYNGVRYSSASQLQAGVASGAIDPGLISIHREVVIDAEAAGVIDRAVYQGPRSEYVLRAVDGAPQYLEVTHLGAVELEEADGTDILRNIEILEFEDGCLIVATMEPCADIGSVTITNAVDVSVLEADGDTVPVELQPLTATAILDAALVTDPDGAGPLTAPITSINNLRFTWQQGETGEAWDPSPTANDGLGDVPGCTTPTPDCMVQTFVPGSGDSGAILRVLITFRDQAGQLHVVASSATNIVENVNQAGSGLVVSPNPPDLDDVLLASPFTDPDGTEDAAEVGITYIWQVTQNGGGTWTDVQTRSTLTDGPVSAPVFNVAAYLEANPGAIQAGVSQIRVTVLYSDDTEFAETLSSAWTALFEVP